MPSTYTQSLRLEKMADGENNGTWGDKLNNTLDLIDVAMSGVTTIDVSGGGTIPLTVGTGVSDQARAPVLVLVGTMSSNVRIQYPATTKWLIVYNVASSTSSTVWQAFISHSATGGVPVDVGCGTVLYGDGSNFNVAGGGTFLLNGLSTRNAAAIGTTLSVKQSATFGASPANISVANAGYLNAGGAGHPTSGPVSYSIAAQAAVVAPTFYATSDARCKTVGKTIDPEEGRQWVLTAKPVLYQLGREEDYRAGFLAQDMVRAGYQGMVMPMADDELEERVEADGFVSPEGVRLNLDYLQTIAYLTAHAQQLEARLEALEAASRAA